MDHDFDRLIDDALRAFWHANPVTATFAGEPGFDACLPRADAAAEADAVRECERFAARLATLAVPDSAAARIDARHLAAHCAHAASAYARRARFRNPAWYTGEAAFGLISLLLAAPDAQTAAALRARCAAIPVYFDAGIERLRDVPIPVAWLGRAQTELRALTRLISDGLPLHPAGRELAAGDAADVTGACRRFSAALGPAPDADAACGADHLALIVEHVHGLAETPAAVERRAATAFERVRDDLETLARRTDPTRSWREQIAQLAEVGPPAGGDIVATYQHWHERALRGARELVSAADAPLTFELLPPWARAVAGDLYFLFYRSPARGAAVNPYWVSPPSGAPADVRRAHNTAAVKQIHAVHHGSVGHHTQNARARTAGSRFARIAGTDGASAIALLAGGTMVEGWACYAEDLMAEVGGFYSAAEELQLVYFELRNIAACLADIRFHTGVYTLDAMRAFYRDDVAFAPARIAPETTRNSMFPGSRIMYWTGTQQIKALRTASALPVKTFHDTLLGFGATPIAWIAEELAR